MTSEWRTRSISLFNEKGEFIRSLYGPGHTHHRNIRAVGEQLIMAMVPTPSGFNPDKLFHEIDLSADSVRYGEAFGDVSEVLGLDGDFEKVAVSIDPGHLVPFSSKRFLFVPKLFWGDVFLAEKMVDGWSLSRHPVGYPGADGAPFEVVMDGPMERGYVNLSSRGRGMIYRRESRGAWLSGSGELLIYLVYPETAEFNHYVAAVQYVDLDAMRVVKTRILERFPSEGPNNVQSYPRFPQILVGGDVLYSIDYDSTFAPHVNAWKFP